MKTDHTQRSVALDQTPPSVASGLGLYCLHMSHKRTIALYGLNKTALVRTKGFSMRQAKTDDMTGRMIRLIVSLPNTLIVTFDLSLSLLTGTL